MRSRHRIGAVDHAEPRRGQRQPEGGPGEWDGALHGGEAGLVVIADAEEARLVLDVVL